MPLSKKQKAAKQEIELAPNVKLLKDGSWGYIHNLKAVYKSTDVLKVNAFSNWVTFVITNEGEQLQLTEGKTEVLPQIFEQVSWRGAEGNNFEAVVKEKY